jgi:hypothetical protein
VEIFINDEPVDFTLEEEKTVLQVFTSVRQWLAGQGYGITAVNEDGRDLIKTDPAEWENKPVTGVREIRFTVLPATEISLEKLQTAYQYVLLLTKAIDRENLELLTDLSKDFSSVEEYLSSLFTPGGSGERRSEISLLGMYLEKSGVKNKKIEDRDALVHVQKVCKVLIVLIDERIRELVQPDKEFKTTIELLSQSTARINEIPLLLQTGKDREAMETVVMFTELSQKLVRLFPILKMNAGLDLGKKLQTGQTLEEFYTDFNTTLAELNDAFQARDTILIGDLLEYEISPRVENLVSLSRSFQE